MTATGTASRLAIAEASEAYCRAVRARFGLAPGARASSDPAAMRGLAYCGREYRVYPSMRVADAARFYAALHERWDAARLHDVLALAGLDERFEIRRMKRAYQRALVVAFAIASVPEMLVVENVEEFDEAPSFASLQRAVDLVPRSIVTYGADVTRALAGVSAAVDAASQPPDAL
ncbi:MAG: hypothetical protein NVS4B5_18640 [Vulcanimicrobiaceae bacterium]